MSATDWLVVAGALAAIAWVNWYFFLADRLAPAPKATGRRAAADDALTSQ
jgi:hypothetical protein